MKRISENGRSECGALRTPLRVGVLQSNSTNAFGILLFRAALCSLRVLFLASANREKQEMTTPTRTFHLPDAVDYPPVAGHRDWIVQLCSTLLNGCVVKLSVRHIQLEEDPVGQKHYVGPEPDLH